MFLKNWNYFLTLTIRFHFLDCHDSVSSKTFMSKGSPFYSAQIAFNVRNIDRNIKRQYLPIKPFFIKILIKALNAD